MPDSTGPSSSGSGSKATPTGSRPRQPTPSERDSQTGAFPEQKQRYVDESVQVQAGSASRKRTRPRNSDDEESSNKSVYDMSRAERKRHREKQRRGSVNKGLDDLMELLIQIDPSLDRAVADRSMRQPATADSQAATEGKSEAEHHTGMSRVDIVQNALYTLRRIHLENEERKLVIMDFIRRVGVPDVLPRFLGQGNETGLQSLQQHTPTIHPLTTDQRRINALAEFDSARAIGTGSSLSNFFSMQYPRVPPPPRDTMIPVLPSLFGRPLRGDGFQQPTQPFLPSGREYSRDRGLTGLQETTFSPRYTAPDYLEGGSRLAGHAQIGIAPPTLNQGLVHIHAPVASQAMRYQGWDPSVARSIADLEHEQDRLSLRNDGERR